MSRQLGLDTLRLRPTPRVAHTEYCDHDPLRRAVQEAHPGQSFEDAWDFDFLWFSDDGVPWHKRGRVTDMGHADFMEGGTDRREAKPSPFHDVEEVWAFDAEKEYGPPDPAAQVAAYEDLYQQARKAHLQQVQTGGYYHSIVSGAIGAFGWDMLLEAAAEPAKFERVLDSFYRLTRHYNNAWAKTSIEAFIQHDDMVWTQGAFMQPEFYRRVIFPRYRELWRPLKAAGKIVLFCSDGNFTPFVDDIYAAGADGLIFEPMTSLDYVVGKYGQTRVIIGSKVDCRTLTFGTPREIQAEIDATLQLARGCPGFMFAIGNHIPANIPLENALFYFDYLSRHWGRR